MNRSELIEHYKATRARLGMAPPRRPRLVMCPVDQSHDRPQPSLLLAVEPPPPREDAKIAEHPGEGWTGLPSKNRAPAIVIKPEAATERPTLKSIKSAVANYFSVPLAALDSDQRHDEVARARIAGYWLARHLTFRSTPQIAQAFSRKNHTTVMSGIKSAQRRMAREREFAEAIEALTRRLTVTKAEILAYWGA